MNIGESANDTSPLPNGYVGKRTYLLGLLIILGCAYSQYVTKWPGLVVGILVVYGMPLLAVKMLWNRSVTRKSLSYSNRALKLGMAWFGILTLVGTIASALVLFMLLELDPSALNLLHRPNPVLHLPADLAWAMVAVSLLVIGPAEEGLFRGFVFRGLLGFFRANQWLSAALLSSVIFAAAHLCYAVVYGIASLVQFTDLVAFGMAMAWAYRLSGGNLLIPAMIHGTYDATGFIGVATTPEIGAGLRLTMIALGVSAAVAVFVPRLARKRGGGSQVEL